MRSIISTAEITSPLKLYNFSLKTSTTWKAGSAGCTIHIIAHWRMLSFCKIPSCFPPFIKPRPSLSHPPRLISSLLLPRFQVKQKHMLQRHRKWRWDRDPPPARAPAGRRPVPSAAWSGSQNLPKGETGNTRGGYRNRWLAFDQRNQRWKKKWRGKKKDSITSHSLS